MRGVTITRGSATTDPKPLALDALQIGEVWSNLSKFGIEITVGEASVAASQSGLVSAPNSAFQGCRWNVGGFDTCPVASVGLRREQVHLPIIRRKIV